MSEFDFNVGDLVEHRASSELGVVVERRKRGDSIIEYQLSVGFRQGIDARSATECQAQSLWVSQTVLRKAKELQVA